MKYEKVKYEIIILCIIILILIVRFHKKNTLTHFFNVRLNGINNEFNNNL